MAKKKLLLPASMMKAGWDIVAQRTDIEAIGFDMNIGAADFHALLADADGVGLSLTRFGPAELAAAPRLRAVARHGVGYDMVDVAALTRAGIPLFVTGTANSPSVAEQALSFMFAFAKRTQPLHAMVHERRWRNRLAEPLPIDLFGKTLLVIGFGRIGTRIAKAAVALGMRVCVYDPYVPAAALSAAGCLAQTDLNRALPEADFVTIHCPKTSETTGMFDATRLARMKSSAYLINTARGGIIDEAALHQALNGGTLAGAGLDVFEKEPPPDDHPLLDNPKVIAAPHMAGVTKEAMDRMAIAVAENLIGALDGKPKLDNVVNPEVFGHR